MKIDKSMICIALVIIGIYFVYTGSFKNITEGFDNSKFMSECHSQCQNLYNLVEQQSSTTHTNTDSGNNTTTTGSSSYVCVNNYCKKQSGSAGYATLEECNDKCNNSSPNTTGRSSNIPASIKGFYKFSWSSSSGTGPPDSNIGVTFTGWMPGDAQGDIKPMTTLPTKFLSYGGGNSNGAWNSAHISALTQMSQLQKIKNLGYSGVCFDIETGSGTVQEFNEAFKAVKAAGLTVMVTTSWGRPYNFSNGQELVENWVQNENIDILSPQLYQTGQETSIDWSQLSNVNLWTTCKAKLAPSVVSYTMYDQVKSKLPNAVGYFQWAQYTGSSSASGTPSSSGYGGNTVRCGTSWSEANSNKNGKTCSNDSDCPSGQRCYANVAP